VILSDREIQDALKRGKIRIDPEPQEEQYTTSALDLLFGDEMYEHQTAEEVQAQEPKGVRRPLIVDPSDIDLNAVLEKYAKPFPPEKDGSFLFPPGKFALAVTREKVELFRSSKIAARVEGRSTLARLGLAVHITAPTIHAGFSGRIVLEMYNFGQYHLRLSPGKLAICQLIFERLGRIPRGPVRTTHQGQMGVIKKRR